MERPRRIYRDKAAPPEWLTEELEYDKSDDNESDTDASEIHLVESESDYDSDKNSKDPNCDTNNNNGQGLKAEYILGRDKITKWSSNVPFQNKRTAKHNIILKIPGVKQCAKHATTPIDSWKLFITDHMVRKIVQFTNIELDKIRASYKNPLEVLPTDMEEMYAVFGLHYYLGLYHASHINLKELWSTDGSAPDLFRATMALKRFYLLSTSLRFDDTTSRDERKKIDNLAPIREFSDQFIQQCNEKYTVGACTTVDEMLESFRGRCKFRQYIANKPAKYGIKIYALVDYKTFYTLNLEIYCGKQPVGPYQKSNAVVDVMNRLCAPILDTGRNIICDNYFPLAKDFVKNRRTTLVGTIRKNKKELPSELINCKQRNIRSSKFLFNDNCTVVSYIPKKNKNVLLLSTLHFSDKIDIHSGSKLKPEILTFYNPTKSGVDVVDQLKAKYSVARETHRWPMVIFYSFMNIAGINSQIIWSENTKNKTTRQLYLRELGKQMIGPHLLTRSKISGLSVELRNTIKKIGGISSEAIEKKESTGICVWCPRRSNKYTRKNCLVCSTSICPQHSTLLCTDCKN